jgi:hypothetical protein
MPKFVPYTEAKSLEHWVKIPVHPLDVTVCVEDQQVQKEGRRSENIKHTFLFKHFP